jgi:prepilin-type processing-associated H-X9-DG protein
MRTSEDHKFDAFTVLELVTVITVIGIVASFMVVKVSETRKRARGAVCLNLLRQISNGLQMYVQDHNCYPPLTDAKTNIACFESLYPYYPLHWTNASWNCPDYVAQKAILSRELLVNHSVGISYAYNYRGVSSWPGCPEAIQQLHLGLGHLPANLQKEAGVLVPSAMYAVADARCELSGKRMAGCIRMSPWSLNYPEALPLHGQGFNMAFCDGHVSFLRREDFLYPPRTAANWNSDHKPHPEGWAPLNMWAVRK